jgi:hypothetical protein
VSCLSAVTRVKAFIFSLVENINGKGVGRVSGPWNNGKVYRLRIIEGPTINAGTKDARGSLPGRRNVQLANGDPVNRIDEETFQIVHTDEILKRI